MKVSKLFGESGIKQAFKASLKILIPLYATYVLFVVSILTIFLPMQKDNMMDQKKNMIHSLTESTWSLLSEYDKRVKQGELTLEDAQQRAVDRVRNLRYGVDGKDYFWIQDMHSRVIMHPYVSELEGKDQTDYVDAGGKHVFAEFARTVNENGSGYVEYMWQWKDDKSRITPKISYVKGFSPWGWVLGTGLYLDDINDEVTLLTQEFVKIFMGVFLIVIVMSFYITWQTVRIERKKSLAEKQKGLEELRLKKILELSQMSDASLNELTEFALEEAISLTGSEVGYIAFLSEDETELSLHTWSKNADKPFNIEDKNLVFKVKEAGLWAEAVKKRDTVLINDYESLKYSEKKGYPNGHVKIIRTMNIPVFDGRKIVAIAGVANKDMDYDEPDTRQLKLMMDGMWKIIQRKRSEDKLRESEERYRLLAENATDNIWIVQVPDLTISYISPSVKQMLGYSPEELANRKIVSIMPENSFEKAMSILKEGLDDVNREDIEVRQFRAFELELMRKDGNKIWTEITACLLKDRNGNPDRIMGISRDITERVELEKRLMHAQKMEALGTLAGGIAHDFNNILSSVFGFTELAKITSEGNEEIQESLNQIMAAGMRARDLVRHILTFSRKADVEKNIIKIQPLIKECLKFLKASIPAEIEIEYEFDETEGQLMASPTQIHQVLMNLFTNATQSMKEKGGTLKVQLKSVKILEGEVTIQMKGLKSGQYLQLTVADTGCGISGELIGRIFEPFFTTKDRGEGTGLGLSTVYGIVKDIDGAISVYSEPGLGTTFVIMIPEFIGSLSKEKGQVAALYKSGSGKIFLVDDEETIIDWSRKALQKLGYEVVTMNDSLKALERFRQTPDEFDLVLTDMSMPRMSGIDLARQISAIRSDLPIILCTGFSVGLTDDTIKESGISDILMKPVILGELTKSVQNALKKK
ncbi:MAG: cache domain-containing protein [Desulfobacteraceae bacterium]|jgi:PAS domain S-box-containing protein